MSTANRMTYFSIVYTDDEGGDHTKWLPVQTSQYGGWASLWRLDPPFLDEHEYVVIRDCGVMLTDTALMNMLGGPMETVIDTTVEVLAANPDGSAQSMTTIREPLSLRRPRDGIDINQILTALGYEDSGQLQYLKADGALTTGTAAQIAAWQAQTEDT